jgi:hypothetical protein
MARQYHVLLSREPAAGSPWTIQFGDYDKATVVAERLYHRESMCCKAKNLRIISSNSARQACLDWLVGQLNNTN